MTIKIDYPDQVADQRYISSGDYIDPLDPHSDYYYDFRKDQVADQRYISNGDYIDPLDPHSDYYYDFKEDQAADQG